MGKDNQNPAQEKLEVIVTNFENPEIPNLPRDIQIEVSNCCRKPLSYTFEGIPYCPLCKRKYS